MSTDDALDRFQAELRHWADDQTPNIMQLKAVIWAMAVDPELKHGFDELVRDKRAECGQATRPSRPV